MEMHHDYACNRASFPAVLLQPPFVMHGFNAALHRGAHEAQRGGLDGKASPLRIDGFLLRTAARDTATDKV